MYQNIFNYQAQLTQELDSIIENYVDEDLDGLYVDWSDIDVDDKRQLAAIYIRSNIEEKILDAFGNGDIDSITQRTWKMISTNSDETLLEAAKGLREKLVDYFDLSLQKLLVDRIAYREEREEDLEEQLELQASNLGNQHYRVNDYA